MPNPDVFVSYSRDDKSRVAPLVQEIKQAGRRLSRLTSHRVCAKV